MQYSKKDLIRAGQIVRAITNADNPHKEYLDRLLVASSFAELFEFDHKAPRDRFLYEICKLVLV